MSAIAVLIPCLNEESSIGAVVSDFKQQLPEATIHVFDNASTDRTAELAEAAGAIVHREPRRGKGNVVQSMFRRVEADYYVMVDGDNTYPAERVHEMLEPIQRGEADMAVGSRLLVASSDFRVVNKFGNRVIVGLINRIFIANLTDVLSGYRAMTRELVKGLPLFQSGFEVETELTIKALERGYRIVEVPTALRARGEDSASKINLTVDGMRILWTIVTLFRDYKPLTVFGIGGLIIILGGLIPGIVAVTEFIQTGLVTHFPSAILSVGMVLTGMLVGTVGLVLHTINRRFQELEVLWRNRSERGGELKDRP